MKTSTDNYLGMALLVAVIIYAFTGINATGQDAVEIMKKSHLSYYYAADDG